VLITRCTRLEITGPLQYVYRTTVLGTSSILIIIIIIIIINNLVVEPRGDDDDKLQGRVRLGPAMFITSNNNNNRVRDERARRFDLPLFVAEYNGLRVQYAECRRALLLCRPMPYGIAFPHTRCIIIIFLFCSSSIKTVPCENFDRGAVNELRSHCVHDIVY